LEALVWQKLGFWLGVSDPKIHHPSPKSDGLIFGYSRLKNSSSAAQRLISDSALKKIRARLKCGSELLGSESPKNKRNAKAIPPKGEGFKPVRWK